MQTSFQNNFTFTGKSPLIINLKNVRKTFFKEFKEVQSPSKFEFISLNRKLTDDEVANLQELKNKLKFIRKFSESFFEEGGLFEVFRGLIGCVKAFKVGNCAEFAEIGKTMLKMNNIKNCDIFTLHAKDKYGKIRSLDHTIIALNTPKTLNNKYSKVQGKYFKPLKDTKILDLWLDGFIGNVQQTSKIYQKIGLMPEETLLFKTEKTYEPDVQTLKKLRETYPKLVFKQINS